MKTAIVIGDGIKQVMLTPETENERQALKMITPDDSIELSIKRGGFLAPIDSSYGMRVDICKGGWLRAFEDSETIMLVLTPKNK